MNFNNFIQWLKIKITIKSKCSTQNKIVYSFMAYFEDICSSLFKQLKTFLIISPCFNQRCCW